MRSHGTSLNKYISSSGICSRREADSLIEQGRVSLNGKVARSGNRVETGDMVRVDGELVKHKNRTLYIALNKPKGIVCTTDSREPANIVSFVNHKLRLFPIGRLDKLSEGLIFLTNDGDIVNKILRAENAHEKEYLVQVRQVITPEFVKKMSRGLRIQGGTTRPCQVTAVDQYTFKIVLREGMNRQIRRMCEVFEYQVCKLKRIRIMQIKLGQLKTGQWRELTKEEINTLSKTLISSKKEAIKSKRR